MAGLAARGLQDRATARVSAQVTRKTDKETSQGFVDRVTEDGSTVYTDGNRACPGCANREWVGRSTGEYVRGQARTNGILSFWALVKRGRKGV
ncbi:MAG: transposase [Acidobacteriota bacterium]|nr:transposase [Acidobacteriota bacterium]